jgi:hypothetical protein
MTALTEGRNTPSRAGEATQGPVAAAVCCYEGGIAVRDSAGNLKPGVTATGLVAVGVFAARADNSSGSAADINADCARGVFRFGNSSAGDAIAKAEIGDVCYIVDDQTVAKTSDTNQRSPAGIVQDVDAEGVWVAIGYDALVAPAGALLAASNLSDLNAAATARGNLGGGANKMAVTLGTISTKGTDAAVLRWVSPVAGTIDKIYSVINGALDEDDATLTAAIGATPVTNGAVTIAESGSAAGDIDSASPSAAKTLAIGDQLTITGGGSSTATATASVSILITPTV